MCTYILISHLSLSLQVATKLIKIFPLASNRKRADTITNEISRYIFQLPVTPAAGCCLYSYSGNNTHQAHNNDIGKASLQFYNVSSMQAYNYTTIRINLLFPISMMTTWSELQCCLRSSSHTVRCSNVSFLKWD